MPNDVSTWLNTKNKARGNVAGDVRAAAGNVLPDLYEMGKGIASLPGAVYRDPVGTAKAAAYGVVQPYVDLYQHPEQQLVEHPVSTALSLLPVVGAGRAFAGGLSEAGLKGGAMAAAKSLVPPVPFKAKPSPQVLHAVPHPKTGLPYVTATPETVAAVRGSGLSPRSQTTLLNSRKFHKTLQDVADTKGQITPAVVREAALREAGVNPGNITRSMVHREQPVGAVRGQNTGAQAFADANRAAARDALGLPEEGAAPTAAPKPQPIGDFQFRNGQWESPNGTYVGDRANVSLNQMHRENFGFDPPASEATATEAPRAGGVKGVAQEILSEDHSTYGPASVSAPKGGGFATNPIASTAADFAINMLPGRVTRMAAEGAKNLVTSMSARRAGTAASGAERLEQAGADAARDYRPSAPFYYGPAAYNAVSALGRDPTQEVPETPPQQSVSLVPQGYASGVPVAPEKIIAETAEEQRKAEQKAPEVEGMYSDDFSFQPPQEPLQRRYGGRTAYKSGGKVGSHVEPLVQRLMIGYKNAKKAEEATTKPLLQHSDQTIVRALRVAKKAI